MPQHRLNKCAFNRCLKAGTHWLCEGPYTLPMFIANVHGCLKRQPWTRLVCTGLKTRIISTWTWLVCTGLKTRVTSTRHNEADSVFHAQGQRITCHPRKSWSTAHQTWTSQMTLLSNWCQTLADLSLRDLTVPGHAVFWTRVLWVWVQCQTGSQCISLRARLMCLYHTEKWLAIHHKFVGSWVN